MIDDMQLARTLLEPGWIDLGYGEPHSVLTELHRSIYRVGSTFKLPTVSDMSNWTYQPSQGLPELVSFLENKYSARVAVSNGAKQGMEAVFYALKKTGHNYIATHSPYWVSTPSLIKKQGISIEFIDSALYSKAVILTLPNNPDGKELSKDQLNELETEARSSGVKIIHDAAYYTPVYVSNPSSIKPFGDVQIYSFSKMYGVSGLRIGYVVCRDEDLFKYIVEFIELSTAGVSANSQQVALNVENFFARNPEVKLEFESNARKSIAESRLAFTKIKPEVMKLDTNFLSSNSMFAWCEAGPMLDPEKAKVKVLSGEMFGDPTKVRLNLALPKSTIEEAVKRLNSV